MINLILFILSLHALNDFRISGAELPDNNVVEKLPHTEIPVRSKVTKLRTAVPKNDNSPGESSLKHVQDDLKIKLANEHDKTIDKSHSDQNKTVYTEKLPPTPIRPNTDQESDFLKSVSMILISISLLFMVVVAFKTYRRKSRNARIKKYGIRLARGNIEMTPLPLDNDDDDDTIFDLKNLPT